MIPWLPKLFEQSFMLGLSSPPSLILTGHLCLNLQSFKVVSAAVNVACRPWHCRRCPQGGRLLAPQGGV